jgi:hypothetical protein
MLFCLVVTAWQPGTLSRGGIFPRAPEKASVICQLYGENSLPSKSREIRGWHPGICVTREKALPPEDDKKAPQGFSGEWQVLNCCCGGRVWLLI